MEEATQNSSPLKLQDKVAVVTGGSRGIGRAISLHLASLGCKLVINYTANSVQANLLSSELNAASSTSRAVAVQADISDPLQVSRLFDAAESSFNSPVHIVVNSAGVLDSSYSSVSDTNIDDFDRTFRVNTRGAFLCMKEAASRLGCGGRIVCMTSSMVAGLKPGYGAYAASKAAVEAMVKVMAKELRGRGITVNCVAPGPVATEMFYEGKTEEMVERAVAECPLGRLGVVEDVAPVVGFLVSEEGGWVNGQVIKVNGGYV
ncbi:hypothetical protein DCAR_0310921 [Daucus carota subsp. sativus]|uniref:Ketoreductase domain-containing protein n=1 Tax=Daucus carota subsp. sativus TaxID=79200 RepID=A0AAF0WLR3_DAUCS|nr:PREDICTED: short-chain type dehydrogenase/reductase-like [Daucus carota subsp. sativus]WOG91671.1 hypothetical protein DCAR_0310921 [Daucus carota subsp. sativus]